MFSKRRRWLSALLMWSFSATGARCATVASPAAWPVDHAAVAPSTDTLTLAFPSAPGPVPYEKFGKFEGVGTPQYRYIVTDRAGLARAVGEGIFPNQDVYKDPAYKALKKEGRLEENQWHYVDNSSAAVNF